jgi:hypothetical protein
MRSLEKEEDVRSISTFEPPIIDFAKTVMLILVGRLACYQFARNIKCANPNPEVGMVKERFKVPRLNSLRSNSTNYLTGQAAFRGSGLKK